MKTFKKTMAHNRFWRLPKTMAHNSAFGAWSEHFEPLKVLESLNNPLIPKLISYDNDSYVCEFIEGVNLSDYIERTRDIQWGITLVRTINEFMYSLLELRNTSKLQLFADDISCVNIMVTAEGRPYIVDLDQFGFFDTNNILRIFKETNMRLYDSFALALSTGTINEKNARIKYLENKLLTSM